MKRKETEKKKSNTSCKCSNYFSTPIYVYIILIVVIAIFLLLAKYVSACDECDELVELFSSIGYSVVASLIVAITTDFGMTKRKNKEDTRAFKIQSANLKEKCGNLPSEICDSVCQHCNDKSDYEQTFEEWCSDLFNLRAFTSKECEKWEIEYCLQIIGEIFDESVKLNVMALYNPKNKNYDGNFRRNLKKLKYICHSIICEQKRGKYEICRAMLVGRFKECVIATFPELEKDYNRKYNAETYAEEAENDEE